MGKTHIVGEKNSFTYDACESRYPKKKGSAREFVPYAHEKLVSALMEKKIPAEEPALVPLWNSNAGTVEMGRRERTVNLFLRKAGSILDLWPEQIVFKLSVKDGEISSDSNIFSVGVAQKQCASFFKKYNIGEDQFEGYGATTAAAKDFKDKATPGDGLLCSEDLLKSNNLMVSTEEVTNPNNFTIFSTFNRLPNSSPGKPKVSLGCVSVALDGDEIPYEFIDYYKNMLDVSEVEDIQNTPLSMPRILFVLRYDDSKALMLMEMDSGTSAKSPWEAPDIGSDLDFHDEVGRVYKGFSLQMSELFTNNFRGNGDSAFYGSGHSYMWVCPTLNISVHGFHKELVRSCANVQVLHLKSLLDSGVEFSSSAKTILRRFAKDPSRLKLSPNSEPEFPHV